MLTIDGALGEGGGQILRTALSLSLCTRRPVRIVNIRPRRARPGLQRQHLTAVQAAAQISNGRVEGAQVGASELAFYPGEVLAGEYRFAIGTAGSTGLVFQTVLPVLLTASSPSRLILEGGTHNPLAPPFEFLQQAFLPLIDRMGPTVTIELERPGFYPAGGGRWTADIRPCPRLQPLRLGERGAIVEYRAVAASAKLPWHVIERELKTVKTLLGWPDSALESRSLTDALSAGNYLNLIIRGESVTEVFTGFGQRGVPAERVAGQAVEQAQRYLAAGVPVAEHLADQLLLPLALAGGGEVLTLRPSLHTLTQMEVIPRFLPVAFRREELAADAWRLEVLPLTQSS